MKTEIGKVKILIYLKRTAVLLVRLIYLNFKFSEPALSGFERKTFLPYNIAVTLVVLTTAGEESITAFFEILHCVQNDTAREFVILNGT